MAAAGLRVGASSININPPMGLRKGGFRLFGEPISSVDDDIELGVAVVQSGGTTVAVIVCDLANPTVAEANEFRDLVAGVVGVPRSHVLFNVSHNHSAPTMSGNNGQPLPAEDRERTEAYQRGVLEKLSECTAAALQSMREARMGVGWGSADLNVYRREFQGAQDVLGEVLERPVDDSVGVIRFDDLQGRAIVTFFRYSCHPVVNGAASPTLSADFPGPARRLIQEKVGGLAFFLQGCGGNVNPRVGIGYERDCSEAVYRVGTALGAEVVRVALGISTHRYQGERTTLNGVPNILFKPWHDRDDHPEVVVAAAEETIPFRYSPLPDEAVLRAEEAKWQVELDDRIARGALSWEIRAARTVLAWLKATIARLEDPNPTCDFLAQAIRIGDVALVGLGVEAFSETGDAIRQASPLPETFVLGFSNGTIMYLPRREDYPAGGWTWPNTYALPDYLPQVYGLPALFHPDSESEAVAVAGRVLAQVHAAGD